MIYGFDYWKTLSHHQKVLLPMIEALVKDGHKVYIISAAGKDREETTPQSISELGLPEGVEVFMTIWEGDKHEDAPRLKYEKCKELGIDAFFDDRLDTCKYLSERGIACFQSPFYKYFEETIL